MNPLRHLAEPPKEKWRRPFTVTPIERSPGLFLGDTGDICAEHGEPGHWTLLNLLQEKNCAVGMFQGEPRMIGGYGCVIKVKDSVEVLIESGWHHEDVLSLLGEWLQNYNYGEVTLTAAAYIEYGYKIALLDKGIDWRVE